jgi:hypothetical protein
MTTKIQDLKRQSFELAQSHTTTTADFKDHVSVLLETVRIKQDEIKTTLSYLDADTISKMQLEAKKIFIKNFKRYSSWTDWYTQKIWSRKKTNS